MAVILLVAMVTVLTPGVMCLTQTEIDQFTARTHNEKNTNIQGTVMITKVGDYYKITANGIPDHHTGAFPGRGNPNSISAQNYNFRVPINPSNASSPKCLPKGPIAFSKNGVPIFNPYNRDGEDAVEGENAEIFDSCDGHPDMRGVYHYHQTPDCLYDGGNDEFVGVALDGFPIYGIKDSDGNNLTSADLDKCHGQFEEGGYRYRLTREFPYVMGCFRGTPSPDIRDRMFEDRDCLIAGSSTSNSPVLAMLVFMLSVLYYLW